MRRAVYLQHALAFVVISLDGESSAVGQNRTYRTIAAGQNEATVWPAAMVLYVQVASVIPPTTGNTVGTAPPLWLMERESLVDILALLFYFYFCRLTGLSTDELKDAQSHQQAKTQHLTRTAQTEMRAWYKATNTQDRMRAWFM